MWLRIIEGPSTGTIVELEGEQFVVGRGDDCDLVLDDAEASRHHAVFTPAQTEGCWVLTDQGSTNGTMVNDVRLDRPVLIQGKESIQIGDTVLYASATDPKATVVERPKPAATPEPVVVPAGGLSSAQRLGIVIGVLLVAGIAIGIGGYLANRNDDELRAKAEKASTVVLERTNIVETTPEVEPSQDPAALLYDIVETFAQDADAYWNGTLKANNINTPIETVWQDDEDIAQFEMSIPCNGEESVEVPALACETGDGVIASFYIPGLEDVYSDHDEAGVLVVMGHTFGHAVGIALGSDSEEIADCFAGAWMRDLVDRNALRGVDPEEVFAAVADSDYDVEFSQDGGESSTREESFGTGIEQGIEGCA